jgi:hypothetical protein
MAAMEGAMRNRFVVLVVVTVAMLHARPAAAQGQVFGYARLGYGAAFVDQTPRAPAVGFGLRAELDTFAIDVSVANLAIAFEPYEHMTAVTVGSWLKLEALRFLTPDAQGSAYVGGGLSWGSVSVGRGVEPGATSWHGGGLQGELTAGYEVGRHSDIRMFVQVNGALPFFRARSLTYSYSRTESGIESSTGVQHGYIPSAVVSIGLGWQRR